MYFSNFRQQSQIYVKNKNLEKYRFDLPVLDNLLLFLVCQFLEYLLPGLLLLSVVRDFPVLCFVKPDVLFTLTDFESHYLVDQEPD